MIIEYEVLLAFLVISVLGLTLLMVYLYHLYAEKTLAVFNNTVVKLIDIVLDLLKKETNKEDTEK